MRIMGLDLGRKRIGVALSDSTGTLARGLETIQRRSNAQVVARLRELIQEWGVERVVVGLPLNLAGDKGQEARGAESYARGLGEALGIEVVLWDERLTTVEAERSLREEGKRPGRRELDARAAAVMLQDYLDGQRTK